MATFVKSVTVVNGKVTGGVAAEVDSADMVDTGVTPGSYTAADITVDAAGRITAAANGTGGPSLPVSLADGGTGVSLSDPGADRILFWDDSAGAVTWLTPGSGLSITGTTLDAAAGAGLPSQTGHGGHYLTTDGSAASWAALPANLAHIAAAFTTDTYFYLNASGIISSGTVTAFGRSLIDDASATAARGTLGAAASGAVTSSGLTMATARLLGRTTASAGDVEEITVGAGLNLSAGSLTSTATGTVTSVNLTAPAAGITVSGGPVTVSGSITLALADDLAALEALSGTNTIYYRSGASTWTAVTVGTALSFSGGTLAVSTVGVGNGGTGQTTAAAARGGSGLNVESGTGRGDAAYTILATDRFVYTNAAFTAARVFTLPAASAVNAGGLIVVADQQGTVTASNTLTVQRAGTDTVNGGTSVVLAEARGAVLLWSDGVSKWTARLLTGANTGTNTGDQTITLTGDVTGSGTGSFAATIGANKVTDSILRDSAALSVIGRSANSTGDPADIAAASDGQVLRRSGTAIGFGALDLASANAVTGTLPAGNLPAASDTAAGKIEVADQTEQEAGSDTTRAVTPGRQHYHPSAAKAWVHFSLSGTTVTVHASYNVSSVTRSAAGQYTVNFTTAMSSASYAAIICSSNIGGTGNSLANIGTKAAGSVQVIFTGASFITPTDTGANINVVVYGDQ